MIKEVDYLIVGGGITGLSTALFLKDKNYLLIEKDSSLGGYCKTIIRNGFVWDYSGHYFHFRNNEIKNILISHLDDEIFEVQKKSQIYYKGLMIDFPFQDNIHQLSKKEFIDCLTDLHLVENNKIENFYDFVMSNYGKSISEKFIVPYNEKLYSCNLNKLDVDAMGRFFPKKINLKDYFSKLKNKSLTESYNDYFIYPKNGSYEFVKSLLKRLNEKKIQLNTELIEIDLKNKIAITNSGNIKFEKLINTTPFDFFYNLTTKQKSNLSSNKVVVFNLGFDRTTDIKNNWIYFPGQEIFYRVGFYNNIFPNQNMSLYVEISVNKVEIIDEKKMLEKVLSDLNKTKIINEQQLIDYQMIVMNPAYVHITKDSKKCYKEWSENYSKFGIYSIGRYGSWTYCSIEDNIIEAKNLTESFL